MDTFNKKDLRSQTPLWQFLLELLLDHELGKPCVTWDGPPGQFRILDPEKLARQWGRRKNRPNMNYDKLTRALRYYYAKNIITKISSKRYTYQFHFRSLSIEGYHLPTALCMRLASLSLPWIPATLPNGARWYPNRNQSFNRFSAIENYYTYPVITCGVSTFDCTSAAGTCSGGSSVNVNHVPYGTNSVSDFSVLQKKLSVQDMPHRFTCSYSTPDACHSVFNKLSPTQTLPCCIDPRDSVLSTREDLTVTPNIFYSSPTSGYPFNR